MAGNSNLHDSQRQNQNEFYTPLSMIEEELKHYKNYFRGKVVFCNADDPNIGDDGTDHFGDGLGGYTSNFWRYFQLNFEVLGLKKLISTHFDPVKPTYKVEMENGEIKKTPLKQNGDYRSPECIEILKEADIVVTNPPFSLFKDYLPFLVSYGKDFLVVGNMNDITFADIIPLVMKNKVWLGYNSGHYWFRVPDYYEEKKTDFKIDEFGQKWRRMGNICWYTTLDVQTRHDEYILTRKYDPSIHKKLDNYDAIFIDKKADIPCDYDGIMAVPITYMTSFNPDQFELLGKFDTGAITEYNLANPLIEGKMKYKRIAIRRKK